MRRGRPRHDDVLTPREWQVLGLLRENLTNEQIAARLGISHDTAKFHVSEIISKLGVQSRYEAAAWRGRPKVAFGFAPVLALLGKLGSVSKLKLAGAGAIATAGVALVLLALGVLMSKDAPSLGKIAFVRVGNIWVQELPDGEPYQLTYGGNASMPRWSPSGEWLLYSTYRLAGQNPDHVQYVVRDDGSDEREVEGEFFAYWLQGTDDVLAYNKSDGSQVTENADGSGYQTLVVPLATSEDGVERFFLPLPGDDDVLVYLETRYPPDADGEDSSQATYYGIWVSNRDGSNARPLVEDNPRDSGQPVYLGWSTDGEHMFFGTLPPFSAPDERDIVLERGFMLQAVPMAGGEPADLFNFNIFANTMSFESPGTLAVAGSGRGSWTNKRIALIAPDASTVSYLTDWTTAAVSPAWSPDGSAIAYAAAPDTGTDGRIVGLLARRIWLMNPDGSNKRQITAGDGFRDEKPMWSNDGRYILFARLRPEVYCYGDRYELMLFDLKDGSLVQVNDNLAMSDWVPSADPNVSSLCVTNSTSFQRDPEGTPNLQQYFDWWQPGDDR